MKKTICVLLVLLMTALQLAGCAQPEQEPEPVSSNIWEVPQLNYGVLQYEKLSVLPWYSGRTEATSRNLMAETKMGYYTAFSSFHLRYADKTDLKYWVRVCNNPSCSHRDVRCGALIDHQTFQIYNGRIYTVVNPSSISHYVPNNAMPHIYSSKPDGTDRFSVMIAPREDTSATSRSLGLHFCKEGVLCNHTVMNTDGTFTHYWHLTNENGTHLIRKVEMGEEWNHGIGYFSYTRTFGDTVVTEGYDALNPLLGIYRIQGDSVEKLNIDHLPFTGMYISGNTARFFRRNDGYYDYDLTTGQEVKVADAQLTDSNAYIVLPNCILETTLLTEVPFETYFATDVETGPPHQLMLFDGESWREVTLPEEVRNANLAQHLSVNAVTSDMIILRSENIPILYRDNMAHFYIIDLKQEDLKLEFLMDRNGRDPFA